jgi:transposase InsO family protein
MMRHATPCGARLDVPCLILWPVEEAGLDPGPIDGVLGPRTKAALRLRDRDRVYAPTFRHRAHNLGIEEVLTAPQSPRQNPYVERLIGRIRRECLDHLVVLHERHLKRILQSYVDYYHTWRPHLALAMNCPESRPVQPPERGRVYLS